MIKYLIYLVAGLLSIASRSFSQVTRPEMDQLASQLDSFTQSNLRTSVYLTTSKDIYVSGEDLWFNAFVLNAGDFTFSALDNTLYLQLQRQGSDSVVWQEMYPVSNGLSAGHVYLPDTLPKGIYNLKAYTSHSFFANQPYYYAGCRIEVVNAPQQIRADKLSRQKQAATGKEDIQFNVFPEGGYLVAGLRNKVAFKAVTREGRPAEIKGTLLQGNTPVLSFKSAHAGMGSFLFTPEKDAVYQVKLEGNSDSVYMLPVIQPEGVVMQLIRNDDDSLVFKVLSRHNPNRHRFFLRLQVRGAVQSIAAGAFGDSLAVGIPVRNAPLGIAEATLFDDQLRPLAERLVYLHPERKLNVSLSPVKEQYAQKEKVSVKIKTTDPDGNPVPAALSVRVYDDLFNNERNSRNIVSYYYLSTQLRGSIYDPAYYFDPSNKDRKEALDLLLLTQGWRRYTWNVDVLRAESRQHPVLSDTLEAHVTAIKKGGKEKQPLSLMLFNYNKSVTQLAIADNNGTFHVTPDHLAIGPRFFIRYFSDKDYTIQVADPFTAIRQAEAQARPVGIFPERIPDNRPPAPDTGFLQYGRTLKEINVAAKGPGFSDRYLGYLDSIAKYEGNTDYVCRLNPKGYLNCPWCKSGTTKPVEGQEYPVFVGTRTVVSHEVDGWFKAEEVKHVVYHYPKYTEEELLKKFKMVVEKGYYQSREFYEPDYDKENPAVADTRNTLFWKPVVVTDKNGEATIQFYSSDIRRQFIGIIEGASGEGLLGVDKFNFKVR